MAMNVWSFCASISWMVRQEFQRNEAMKTRVFGFVDHAHAAAAQFFNDAVVRNDLTDK
jgi:hypothetical protein